MTFGTRAVFGAAVVWAVVFLFCVFSGAAQAAEEKAQKVYTMPAHKIAEYIQKTEGRKRIVFIYASWCPYCQKKFPGIMDIERTKKGSVIAVSVDEDHGDFARYLRRFKNIPFPVVLHRGSSQVLKDALRDRFDIPPWSGIPYTVWLDADNNVVYTGNYSVKQSAEFLFSDKYDGKAD